MRDKILLYLSLTSLCALCFVAGAATMHFRPNYIQAIKNGFIGAEGVSELKSTDKQPRRKRSIFISYKPLPAFVDGIKGEFYPGYTLLNNSFSNIVQLVADDGNIVKQWNVPFQKAWPGQPSHINVNGNLKDIETAHVFTNGSLLVQYSGVADTPYGYGLALYDINSKLIWKLSENAHHDLYVSPDESSVYAITQKFEKYPVKGFEYLSYPQLMDYIVKLSKDGEVLERIDVLNAFRDTEHAKLLQQQSTGELKRPNIEVWDALHTNSIRVLEEGVSKAFPGFATGDYLISLRNTGIVAVIDHASKKVKWSMCCQWKEQHAARFTGNGTIILFDNHGRKLLGHRQSRILEVNPTTKKVTELYIGDQKNRFYSNTRGRVEVLPNNNLLIVESNSSRVFEINKKGQIVWQYKSIFTGNRRNMGIPYAKRYSKEQLKFVKEKVMSPAADAARKN